MIAHYGNAKQHIGEKCRNLYKIDFSAFFPSISRECVYRFFLDDLMCSPDIANILTNLTTIDLEQSKAKDIDDIYSFLKGKNCFCTNHLISGAPTSQILSYLANHCMFDEMQKLASQNHAQMTVYVDDVTFSSECWISHSFRQEILNLVKKYGYQISRNKVKLYTKSYPKLVTGVIISPDGKAIVKNSMRERIIKEFEHLHRNPTDFQSRQRLCGLLTAARQVNPDIFPSIYAYAYERTTS